MDVRARMLGAALRAAVAEVADDPAAAAQALAALLGAPVPVPAPPPARLFGEVQADEAPVTDRDPKPGNVNRDPKPENVTPPATRSRGRPRKRVPATDAQALAEQLVERHGTLRAAWKASGVHEQQLRRFVRGERSATRGTITRMREALEAPVADDQIADAGEAAELVRQLEASHGTLAAVAERFGINREVLRRWKVGRPCSARNVERLRQALASPVPGQPVAADEPADVEQAEAPPKVTGKGRRRRAAPPDTPMPNPSGRRFGARVRGGLDPEWSARVQARFERAEGGEATTTEAEGEQPSAQAGRDARTEAARVA